MKTGLAGDLGQPPLTELGCCCAGSCSDRQCASQVSLVEIKGELGVRVSVIDGA